MEAFLNGADQSNLDPRLDTCVEKYKKLDEDRQVDFKSSAKAFTRLYAFLDAQLSWTAAELAIFLSFLISKLPEWEGLTWLEENLVSRRVLASPTKLPRIEDLRVRIHSGAFGCGPTSHRRDYGATLGPL